MLRGCRTDTQTELTCGFPQACRLRASADAGRWRYDSGDFGKPAAPAGAKAGGGARATLDFEEAAAATVAPVVVQQSLKQVTAQLLAMLWSEAMPHTLPCGC